MNQIIDLTNKGLTLTAIAYISSLASLVLPHLVANSQTASLHYLQSASIPIEDKEDKLIESSLAKTVTLVKELEGFRSYAYIDTDGTAVIGYGMSIINGRRVKLGDLISQVQAEIALKAALQEIQQQILTASTVELDDNQLAALTSFAFNVGVEPLFQSTLFKKLNAGDFLGAAHEFPRWDKANMGRRLVPLAGLTKRRQTEKSLFLTSVN